MKPAGLRVRSRRGFVAAPKGPVKAALPAAGTGDAGRALDEALASPVAATGARLRAFAAPFQGAGAKHGVLVGLLLDGRDLEFADRDARARAGALFEVVVLDEAGRVAASTRNNVDVEVPASNVEAVRTRGLRYLDRVELAPGRYHVRAGVALGGTRVGTVQCPLDVPDFSAGGPALSGVLVSSRRPAPGLSTDASDAQRLPGPPTAQRRFAPDDELTLFAELYPSDRTRALTVGRHVLDAAGGRVLEAEERVEPTRLAAGGPIPLRSSVPLETLAPGRYRFRLEVRDGDAPPLASREVVFAVVDATDAPRPPTAARRSG